MIGLKRLAMQSLETQNKQKSFYFAHVAETTSTNSDLLSFVKQNDLETPLLLWADNQTAGRGTRGREWKTPSEALLFSLAIPLKLPIQHYIGVTLTIGKKIVRFLRSKGMNAALKWPNDIVVDGKKMAGILVENTKNFQGRDTLVIGVGLNLKNADFELEEYGACAVQDFIDLSVNFELKNAWVNALGDCLIDAVDEVAQFGLEKTVKEWKSVAAYQGETIDLYQEGEIVCRAVQHGIDESGRLLISTPDGIRAYMSGTISLRKK